MVLISAALALQTALLVALFYEDRRRRRSEANARVLMAELAHMNRVVTAGQLTASLAHEIRQPLSAIAAFCRAGLNWLKHEPPNLEEARSGLENSINQVHRADEVIRALQPCSRMSPQREPRSISTSLFNRFLLSRHER